MDNFDYEIDLEEDDGFEEIKPSPVVLIILMILLLSCIGFCCYSVVIRSTTGSIMSAAGDMINNAVTASFSGIGLIFGSAVGIVIVVWIIEIITSGAFLRYVRRKLR